MPVRFFYTVSNFQAQKIEKGLYLLLEETYRESKHGFEMNSGKEFWQRCERSRRSILSYLAATILSLADLFWTLFKKKLAKLEF